MHPGSRQCIAARIALAFPWPGVWVTGTEGRAWSWSSAPVVLGMVGYRSQPRAVARLVCQSLMGCPVWCARSAVGVPAPLLASCGSSVRWPGLRIPFPGAASRSVTVLVREVRRLLVQGRGLRYRGAILNPGHFSSGSQ